jgi:hypothetical protein
MQGGRGVEHGGSVNSNVEVLRESSQVRAMLAR